MRGLAHLALFNFIYEISGPGALAEIKRNAGITSDRVFKAHELYDELEWQNIINETCKSLNITKKRLIAMSDKFFNSHDTSGFQDVVLPKSDKFKTTGMCPLPFSQLFLNNKGKINPCGCLRTFELGDIKENTLEEIWNGKAIKELRESHLNGDFRFCKKYMQNFNCHQQHDLLEYDSEFEYSVSPKTPIRRLDLDLNAWCNLKCVMCTTWQGENGSYTDENFWNNAEEKIFPHLHEVALLGGEPMLQSDTFRLMEVLSRVSPHCRWNITTNGQYKLSKKMMEKLDLVEVESIGISLDSLNPDTYAKIRVDGKLEKSLMMIDDLISYNQSRGLDKKFLILVNMLISQDTFHEIPGFFKYAQDKRIKLNPEILMIPHELSIWALSENKRLDIFHRYVDENEKMLNTSFFNIVSKLFNSFTPVSKLSCIDRYINLKEKIQNRLSVIDKEQWEIS